MGPCRPPIVRIAIGASTGTGRPGLSQNRAARLASLKQRCFLHALNARHQCAGGLENVVSSGAAPISQAVEEQEKFDFAEKSPSGATVSGCIQGPSATVGETHVLGYASPALCGAGR